MLCCFARWVRRQECFFHLGPSFRPGIGEEASGNVNVVGRVGSKVLGVAPWDRGQRSNGLGVVARSSVGKVRGVACVVVFFCLPLGWSVTFLSMVCE